MRIWDLPCACLCRQHLLGEHRELHAIWVYLTTTKGHSYRKHTETLRWRDRLDLLYARHEEQVTEMQKRGYNHKSPLDETLIKQRGLKKKYINTIAEQKAILKSRQCSCKL